MRTMFGHGRRSRRRRGRWSGAVVVGLVVVLAAACVPYWEGSVDAFYELPPAGAQAPGTLVRVQKVPGTRYRNVDVYRVAYWTRSRGGPVVATGTVSVPVAKPPAARPIMAYDHGTTGMGPRCAPSRSSQGMPTFLVESGNPVVAPDYIGLGPAGQRHSYLSGGSEARATVDLVRAARALPNVVSDGSWYVLGASQGGHAALFTGEEAADYAPELQLKGVVAAAPGTQLVDESVIGTPLQVLFVMVVAGLSIDYPELDVKDYLTPAAEARLGVLDTGCLNDITAAFATLSPLVDVDPTTDDRLRQVLTENSPGHQRVGVPMLVVQGTADPLITPTRTLAYALTACANGERLKLISYPGVTHDGIVTAATADIQRWLLGVQLGQPAPTSCP